MSKQLERAISKKKTKIKNLTGHGSLSNLSGSAERNTNTKSSGKASDRELTETFDGAKLVKFSQDASSPHNENINIIE